MITVLLLTMLFGGGSAELFARSDFTAVQRSIYDSERVEQATDTMLRMNSNLDALVQFRAKSFERLGEIDEAVDAGESQYERVFELLWTARRDAHSNYITDVFELRDAMSREEWNAAFGSIADQD